MDTLTLKRVWEDVDFYQVEIAAETSHIRACTRSYITVTQIDELASRLSTFPQNSDDRYFWEASTKGNQSTPYASLEFWCEDKLGHIIIEVYMELDDGASYDKHNCCFYLRTESGLLNSFGKSLSLLNEMGTDIVVSL